MASRRSGRGTDKNAGRYSSGRYGSSASDPSAHSRYSRSRYGSSSPSGRAPYRDTFYEEMNISDEDLPPIGSGHGSHASPSFKPYEPSSHGASSHTSSSHGASSSSGAHHASPSFTQGQSVSDYSRYNAKHAYGVSGDDTYGSSSGGGHAAPKRRRRRKLPIILAILLVLVLGGAGAAYAYVNVLSGNLHANIDQDLRDALVETDMANEPFYMVLLGTDGSAERDATGDFGGLYRSDSLMLARIDPVEKKVTLISIGRDIIVDLPGYGEQKINAAFGLGGPSLAVQAVSQLAGVPISHYAQVDFDGFSSLVDALGGIEVEVPVEIDDWEAGGYVAAGWQELDGYDALVLCRSRATYSDTAAHPDEMRAANQRLVMGAIAKKLLDSDVATIANSVQAMSQFVSTDLEITDLIGLAQIMQGLDPGADIYTAMAPTNSQYIDDTWCEYIDKPAWTIMMDRVKAGLPPTEEELVDETTGTVLATAGGNVQVSTADRYVSITVKNGTERQGLAAQTRTKLMDAGYVNVIVGDIVEGYYPKTLVIYDNELTAYGAQQIVDVLGQGEAIFNDGSYLLSDTDYLLVIGEDWED